MPNTTPYETLDTTPYTTPDTTPRHTRSEISILNEYSVNKIKNDEKNINTEVFNEYFGYQNPSFLAEDLFKANQVKNDQIVDQTIDSINELRNSIVKKEIPENENLNKITDIVEKSLSLTTNKKEQDLKY